MLSRSAQGLYWMGRYLERTDHLCNLLLVQTEALVDRPGRDIYAGWRRLYVSLQRDPPGGGLALTENDDFTLADSYTLASDLTFERTNPDSVWNCFAQSRENARQMRHLITAQMWRRLNLAYLRIRDLDIADIWAVLPEDFYAGMMAETDGFAGAAAATMYRDEGWRFLQLGRFVERVQCSTSLLLTQMALDAENKEEEFSEVDWTGLLRACHALEAYDRHYGATVQPDAALDLLVTDPRLARSLYRSLTEITGGLESLGVGPGTNASIAAQRIAGRLAAAILYDWPDSRDKEALLQRALEQSLELHALITVAFFDYPVDDSAL